MHVEPLAKTYPASIARGLRTWLDLLRHHIGQSSEIEWLNGHLRRDIGLDDVAADTSRTAARRAAESRAIDMQFLRRP